MDGNNQYGGEDRNFDSHYILFMEPVNTWSFAYTKRMIYEKTQSSVISEGMEFTKILRSKGRCAIYFSNKNVRDFAVEKLQGATFDDQKIKVMALENDEFFFREGFGDKDNRDNYTISISPVPHTWSHEKGSAFLMDSLGPVLVNGINFIKTKNRTCLITFKRKRDCDLAVKKLAGALCDGIKLNVIIDPDIEAEKKTYQRNPGATTTKRKFNQEVNTVKKNKPTNNTTTANDYEVYGLSQEFLDELGIDLPLQKTIIVKNLHSMVDEAKLREVFSFAGHVVHVLMLSKISDNSKMGKVEFDHPVEAVQAISMFNGQRLHEQNMQIRMDPSHEGVIRKRPLGMTAMGPGLGKDGQPMRNVRGVLELTPLKQTLLQEISALHEEIEKLKNEQTAMKSQMGIDPNIPLIASALSTAMPTPIAPVPMVPTAIITPSVPVRPLASSAPLNMATNLLNQNTLMDQNALNPQANIQMLQALIQQLQNQSMVQDQWQTVKEQPSRVTENYDYGSFVSSSGNRNAYEGESSQAQEPSKDDKRSPTDMLVFNDLPPSVTIEAFKIKMSEVGNPIFAEVSEKGRAIVRFDTTKDAERCMRLFDRSKVDGQIISVKYI